MSISEIIALSSHVEKLGIIGVLTLLCAIMAWALLKYRRENTRIYRQRDRARMISVRYRSALDHAGVKVDISDIEQMFKDDLAEESA